MKDNIFDHVDLVEPLEDPRFIEHFPVPRLFSRKQSFIWWWWMVFFEEDGVRKQFVGFWTGKTYRKNKVNGHPWDKAFDLEGDRKDFSYNGMSTWWHWDGKTFQEAHPKVSRFKNVLLGDGYIISSDDVQNSISPGNFKLEFCRDPGEFRLLVDDIEPNPPPVGYKRTLLTKKMGFDALKIYNAKCSGTISTHGRERPFEGSLYMQNIGLNSPAFPWLWGVFHKDDGSYLTYFTSFMGPYMFRRKADCRPFYDNRFKFLNKNLNYTPKGEETKRFKHVRYKVIREGKGLPEVEAWGTLGEEKLKIRVRAIAKTTYAFKRFKWWPNRFFYNEFPSEIVYIEYTDADGKVHRQDGAEWTGNTEYSWGILLN